MKRISNGILVALVLLLNSTFVFSQGNIWQDTKLSAKLSDKYGLSHYFDANDQALRSKLSLVPNEVRGTSDTIELPMPDGSLAKFSIVESSIMEDGLAEQFPQIKSYKVYGIDDPTASGRVDMSPKGFRGMLMTTQGRVFIDPAPTTASRYTSSFRSGNRSQSGQPFHCSVNSLPGYNKVEVANFSRNEVVSRTPGSLITYRLAVSTTKEYATAVGGGTVIGTMAEVNNAINRVNQVYERDLGIRLILVANNSAIIEIAPAEFGLTNGIEGTLIGEIQAVIDAKIGTANYDIGHVFMTGSGGVASSPSVCTVFKAQGVTGQPNPTGDPFWIDYVAHEIGHQFSGSHTFNASSGACTGANRSALTAFEPGSGSTIMSYAGICNQENIVTASDATFHAMSIAEIGAYVTTGNGASCATAFAITPANSDPTDVTAGVDRTIPRSTPFELTGSALDAGDTLTYQWDQIDLGTVATTSFNIGTDQGNNPLFRSHIPQPTGVRQFPSMGTQVNGTTAMLALGETLPTTSRTLNFRVTARDGKSGQGTDDVAITVDAASGPFAVLSPNGPSTFAATDGATVTWNVANTTSAPVSCANVNIGLLTFSTDGSTYGVTSLLSSTPNDGTQTVVIPDMSNSKARFVVFCSDNIFYDISDADLNITGAGTFPTTGNSTNVSTVPNYTAITTGGGGNPVTPTTPTTPASSSGGGTLDSGLIEFLLGMLLIVLLTGASRHPVSLIQLVKK